MKRLLILAALLLVLVTGTAAQTTRAYTFYVSTYYGGRDAATQYFVVNQAQLKEMIDMLHRIEYGNGRYGGGTYDGFWLTPNIWVSTQIYENY